MSLYNFDMSKNWMDERNKAAARGDRAAAEQAERNRNQKIDILGLNEKKTYDYIDRGTNIVNGVKEGADPNYVLEETLGRYNKAKSNPEYSQYAYDEIQDMGMRYYYNSLAGEKPTYQSKYGSKIDELLNKVLNGGSFSYNVTSDPVYQAYKEQYTREGNRAMQDTLAGLSMDAGGENSWAVSAAAQANNRYMQELSDKIPELEALAYEKYLADRNADMNRLSALQQMESADYGKYIDAMNIYQTDRNFYDNQYNNWKNDARQDKQWDYEKAQADLATFVKAGKMPPQDVLLRAGVTDPTAINALIEQVQSENEYNNAVRGYDLAEMESNKILNDLAVQKALGQNKGGNNPYTGPEGPKGENEENKTDDIGGEYETYLPKINEVYDTSSGSVKRFINNVMKPVLKQEDAVISETAIKNMLINNSTEYDLEKDDIKALMDAFGFDYTWVDEYKNKGWFGWGAGVKEK